jgi:hypothetical protein
VAQHVRRRWRCLGRMGPPLRLHGRDVWSRGQCTARPCVLVHRVVSCN